MRDITIVSNCNIADGVGRQGIGALKTIKNDFDCNYLSLQPPIWKDIPSEVIPIISREFDGFGNITLWEYVLGIHPNMEKLHKQNTSKLKIAYTMLESDAIPTMWVNYINKYFDMAVVPDPWLVDVYKSSGVKKPVFVLPLGIWIEKFLEQPIKKEANDVFTFGMTAGFWERKNHIKLIKVFKEKFGNNPKFKLKLHGRFGAFKVAVEQAVKEANLSNLEFLSSPLSQTEYLEFMKSLDCYVFPSKGEGFSITPRESLALGIPCVLTNNTAHKTIINSGFTISVKAKLKCPAFYEVFNAKIGNAFDCTEQDLGDAMDYVVANYAECLQKMEGSRDWVKQYLWEELKPLYLSMLKPKNIKLGKENKITLNGVETTDNNLINIYKEIYG